MMGRFATLVDRLAAAGALPTDSEDERLRKGALMLMPILSVPVSSLWVVTYAVLGHWVAAAIPFAYQLVSTASVGYFLRTKRYGFFRRSQLLMILLLPCLLQWSLGGFAESGAVMIWAVA